MKVIFFLLIFLFQTSSAYSLADPEAHVNWTKKNSYQDFNLTIKGDDPLWAQCLNSGFELQYRYEFQLCKKRSTWFDSCGKIRKEFHRLRYVPVTGQYELFRDRHGDIQGPENMQFESDSEAREKMITIDFFPMTLLFYKKKKINKKRHYLRVRVMSDCRGKKSEITSQLSRILTLGLVKVEGFNTGWVDFTIDP